jgi:hypothetical protein
MCNDKTIKELLPAYREQVLDQAKNLMIENHLAACEDCRIELSLLRMMTEEAVPDPGEAFWAAMPGRVYQAVQKRNKVEKKAFGFAWFVDRMTLPRLTWVAASVTAVLLLSWLVIRPVQKEPAMPALQGSVVADEIIPVEQVNITELDNEELSNIETWAGSELAAIARESEPFLENGQDSDMYEELGDMNAQQAERLRKMINQQMKEDYT